MSKEVGERMKKKEAQGDHDDIPQEIADNIFDLTVDNFKNLCVKQVHQEQFYEFALIF